MISNIHLFSPNRNDEEMMRPEKLINEEEEFVLEAPRKILYQAKSKTRAVVLDLIVGLCFIAN